MSDEVVKVSTHTRVRVEGRVHARVVHLRTREKGSITVAYKLLEPGSIIIVGLGFGAPGDTFSRHKGRKYAEDRLYSNPIRFSATPNDDPVRLSLRLLMQQASENTKVCVGDRRFVVTIPVSSEFFATITAKSINVGKPFLGADWLGKIKPWVFDCVKDILDQPAYLAVNWYYHRLKEGTTNMLEEGGDETTGLRREWWYEAGNTYVYQARMTIDEPWGIVVGEYENEGYPKWVAEKLLAYGLDPKDIRPEGVSDEELKG